MRYLCGVLLSIPLLPLLYIQAKMVRRAIPRLPEARHPQGTAGSHYNNPFHLWLLGESTVAGVGVDNHTTGFSGTLARELSSRLKRKISWAVHARSGYTLKKVREVLLPRHADLAAPPDLIIIGTGGNDAFELNRPGRFRNEARITLERLEEVFPGTPVFFISMPPIKAFPAFTPVMQFVLGNLVEILGDELEKVVRDFPNAFYDARPIRLVDWAAELPEGLSTSDLFSDGVHPSELTYQLWARKTAERIARIWGERENNGFRMEERG